MSVKEDLKRQADETRIATVAIGSLQSVAAYQAENEVKDHQMERVEASFQKNENRPNLFDTKKAAEVMKALRQDYEGYQKAEQEFREKQSESLVQPNAERLTEYDVFMQLNSTTNYEDDGIYLNNANEIFAVGNWIGCLREAYNVRAKCNDSSLPKEMQLYYQKQKVDILKANILIDSNITNREMPEKADNLVDRAHIRQVNAVVSDHQDAYAYFSPWDNIITMHKYSAYEQQYEGDYLAEYTQNNPVAQASVFIHENVHKDHHNYDGDGALSLSVVNAAKGDRLTETIACAAQYLHVAHQYTLLKESGVEEILLPRKALLGVVLHQYNGLPEQDRPDIVSYLKSYDIETLHITETKSLKDVLVDYRMLDDENKPSEVDYLKERGIEKLRVSETIKVSDLLNDWTNWKGEGERPSFDEYLEQLDEKGGTIQGCEVSEYVGMFLSEEDKDNINKGDFSALLENDEIAQVDIVVADEVSVEEFRDKFRTEGKVSEMMKELHLDNVDYRLSYDRSVEEIAPVWKEIHQQLQSEEVSTDKVASVLFRKLDAEGLEEAYVSGFDQRPITEILEWYPGLKEVVMEHGFDPKDSASVARVVKASSNSWHKDRENGYNAQMIKSANAAKTFFSCRSWSEQLEILKNQDQVYQDVSEKMLKDVYIGHNTTVDLSGCRGMLDTLSEETMQQTFDSHNRALVKGEQEAEAICNSPVSAISYEEMKAVDDYLENRGLKTDDEKMAYMAEYLDNEAYRRGENRDEALRGILLKYNSRITYEDGLSVDYKPNGKVLAVLKGEQYDLTSYSIGNGVKVEQQQTECTGENRLLAQRLQNTRD